MDAEFVLLLRYLIRSGKVVENRIDDLLGNVDLSATKMLSLRYMEQAEEPLPLGQLASSLAFVKSNMTQLADHLEADHLVERVPDVNDRRSKLLKLTDEGKHQCNNALKILEPLESQLRETFTPDEQRLLIVLLQRLNDALE